MPPKFLIGDERANEHVGQIASNESGLEDQDLQNQLEAAVLRSLRENNAFGGREVNLLEMELRAFCNVSEAITCASYGDALLLALASLGIGPDDEVILSPMAPFATVSAVIRSGATPVFADIDSETYTLDPEKIEAKITDSTRAFIATHLFGQSPDMRSINRIAVENGMWVIENFDQAFGPASNSKGSGITGDLATFNFGPGSTLSAYGNAGLIVTNDTILASKIRSLQNAGTERHSHKYPGWEARLDSMGAEILRVKLPSVGGLIESRREEANLYDRLIKEHGIGELVLPQKIDVTNVQARTSYVVQVSADQRSSLIEALNDENIDCMPCRPPLHMEECVKRAGFNPGPFPVSEDLSLRGLSLPMFSKMEEAQIRKVVSVCRAHVL